ncbi:MAG: penicillin-binding protein 2 [Geobacter sp.]|nr:penicillin-binding protein 2 [Geobacter sp.]
MNQQRYVRDTREKGRRVIWGAIFAVVIFFVLITRLWYLQILQGDSLRVQSESNRLRFVPVAASRGTILDRNGKVLVSNTPSFSVAVIPQEVKEKDALFASLARYLQLDPSELQERWEKGKGRAKYYPIILLGYLGEINEQELEANHFRSYNPGDYVGKSGLERSWEEMLHGTDGGRQIEVDARGRYLRTLSETKPAVGNSLVLTIDLVLQQAAEKAFGDRAGAAVVVDVNTGEILAFASSPSFDPALFSGRMPPDIWTAYLEDKRHPLENKALKGQYPPGSTFKIITALAGLESGLIDERTTVNCTGAYEVGTDVFKCWDKKGHGRVDLKRAIRESCDVYFYQLGERLGVDRIAEMARRFGLGAPMGIGLENEKGGLIPTMAWKQEKFKKKWYRGETMPVSIGQGYTLLTPIQLATMTAAVANEGTVYRPYLVKRVIDPDGKVIKETKPEVLYRPQVRPNSFRLVKEGLLAVVNEPRGTGGAARLCEVRVAGKTGSSQVVKQRGPNREVAYQYRDHALFVAFAPYDKPAVAVSVVIEHGEHGGAAAAPVAGAILRAYFEQKGVIKRPVPQTVDETEEEAPTGADRGEGTHQ